VGRKEVAIRLSLYTKAAADTKKEYLQGLIKENIEKGTEFYSDENVTTQVV